MHQAAASCRRSFPYWRLTRAQMVLTAADGMRNEEIAGRPFVVQAASMATTMAVEMTSRDPAQWTEVERAREERARAIRTRQDEARTPEERLEETLRLSKLMSELQQGAAGDVPSR